MKTYKRAATDGQKNEVMERLLLVWKANPELRFMQLLGNVFIGDAYAIEDYDMIADVEAAYSSRLLSDSRDLTPEPPPASLGLAQERKPKPKTKPRQQGSKPERLPATKPKSHRSKPKPTLHKPDQQVTSIASEIAGSSPAGWAELQFTPQNLPTSTRSVMANAPATRNEAC